MNLVEGGQVVLRMENLIAGYSRKADGKTYTFDVVVTPVDVAVSVGEKQLQSFTNQQVQVQLHCIKSSKLSLIAVSTDFSY